MQITIVESKLRFKNPNVGQPTRSVEEHYDGRRVIALVNGREQLFRFKANELPFDADEDTIEQAVLSRM